MGNWSNQVVSAFTDVRPGSNMLGSSNNGRLAGESGEGTYDGVK